MSVADWKVLSDGPVLLFVHGTFSTTEGGFGQLKPATLKTLHARYGGRVIAFDHPTIADDPIENARQFFEIAGDRKLELDVVCHSRGGLVARSIAERPGDLEDLATGISVRTIVLVGVPSNGTILAKAKYWDELLNRMTTLLSLFPGPGMSDTLETVLAVVRSIAVETVESLEGLDAMAPGGDFLKRLNIALATEARYRAIVLELQPQEPGPEGVAQQRCARRDLRSQTERHDGDDREHDREERLEPVSGGEPRGVQARTGDRARGVFPGRRHLEGDAELAQGLKTRHPLTCGPGRSTLCVLRDTE